MRTVTVELRNNNALRLLKDLELANIIRVLDKGNEQKKQRLIFESLDVDVDQIHRY